LYLRVTLFDPLDCPTLSSNKCPWLLQNPFLVA
jgi:hypothetical protein